MPNFSIHVDEFGILYLGQQDRIAAFNGSSWIFINSPGRNMICSNNQNTIFFANENDLGFLIFDSLNTPGIISIKEKLPSKYQSYKQVKNILGLGDGVIFQIDNALLLYKAGNFKTLFEKYPCETVYHDSKRIVFALPDGKLIYLNELLEIKEYNTGIKNIHLVIPHKENYLIFDKLNNFYPAGHSFNIISKKILPFISGVVSGFALDDGNLFVSDSKNSIFLVRMDGQPIMKMEVPEIPSSQIVALDYKPGRGIWILQERSLHLLEYPFPFKNVIALSPDSGIIHHFTIHQNIYYLATSKGLYYYDPDKNSLKHARISDFCYHLISTERGVCAITSDKVYLIVDYQPEIIYEGLILDYSYAHSSNLLFLSNPSQTGICLVKLDSVSNHHSRNYKTSITPLNILSQDTLIWYTDYKKLFCGSYSDASGFIEREIKIPGEANIRDMFIWENKLNLKLPGKIFYWSGNEFISRKNVPYDFYGTEIYESGDNVNGNLVAFSSGTNMNPVLYIGNQENQILRELLLPSSFSFHLPSFELQDTSRLLFSTGSGIIDFDINAYQKKICDFRTNITGIITGNDTIFDGLSFDYSKSGLIKKLNSIQYNHRLLKIMMGSSNYFDKYPQFQYTLNKQENKWSEWNSEPAIIIDLPQKGNYELWIRTKNDYGLTSPITLLNFRILKPFYRSIPAYLIYFLILSAFAIIIYRSYRLSIIREYQIRVSTENDIIHGIKTFDQEVEHKISPAQNLPETGSDKGKDQARWDKYEMVTVLFSDIQGFTKIAESTNPEVLIDELDRFFFHFDSVVEKYNIEKIKTIGDAYMAAGGIPKKNKCNPIEVVLAAFEMQHYMKQLKNTKVDFWDLRIGIHSGPVIAGIVGHKKRSYDIWGDTVNTASRMESSGEAGKINISGITYSLIKDFFICEHRGKLPVKYKGNIDMYFVKGIRPELSVNLAGIPNRRFYLKLQMLRLDDLEETILNKLETELPKNLYFHNLEYTKHLFTYTGLLSKAENLDGEEILLLLTTVLLMNVGYIHNYEYPERGSDDFAKDILQEFNYSDKQIIYISNLIEATINQNEPKSISERLLHDILTEYLGMADFSKLYKLLFLEQNEYHISSNVDEFKKQQIEIIKNHIYYSNTANRLREVPADEQIKRIIRDPWS